MTPPHVPGYPGARLPAGWEKPLADLERRVAEIEDGIKALRLEQAKSREKLDSFNDLDFDENSQVTIPTDAPKAAKGFLGALQGVPARHRAAVIVALGLPAIIAIAVLVSLGVKVW